MVKLMQIGKRGKGKATGGVEPPNGGVQGGQKNRAPQSLPGGGFSAIQAGQRIRGGMPGGGKGERGGIGRLKRNERKYRMVDINLQNQGY